MTDREVMHKLLDKLLDTGEAEATHVEFFPGISGKVLAVQKVYRLEIAGVSCTVTDIKE